MKLLKSSLEKENDDHDIFGAYVAMEMRNLKTSDAQTLLRTEIRNAISRVVSKESTATNEHTGYPVLIKRDETPKELNNDLSESDLSDSSANDLDNVSCKIRKKKPSWIFIN